MSELFLGNFVSLNILTAQTFYSRNPEKTKC